MPSELGVAGQERLDRGGCLDARGFEARVHAREIPGSEFDNSLFNDLSLFTLVQASILMQTGVLRPVVVLAAEVGLEDRLGAGGVALLGVERGTGHVGDGRVAALAEGAVGCVAERVVLGCWLREPDVTAVATELARLESISNVLLNDDGATGGVDEPRACSSLAPIADRTLGLLVERAVDGDNVTLGEHLLKVLDTPAADFLLDLWGEGLVVEVQKLLAVEGLQTAQDTLTDTANGDGTDGLALEVVLVLGDLSDVPVASCNLLVSRHEVADEGQDGHNDVLSDRDDVGASDLSDGDTAVDLVGDVQVDVVRTNTSGDGKLEVLGLPETLLGQPFAQQVARAHKSRATYGRWSRDNWGSCLACSLPCSHLISSMKKRLDSSEAQLTSYKHRRTLPCREEVAVSVLTAIEKSGESVVKREDLSSGTSSLPQAEAWLSLPIPDLPFAVAVRGKTCLVPRKWSLVRYLRLGIAGWSSSFALSPYIGEEPEHTSVLDQFHDASASAPPLNGHSGDMLMIFIDQHATTVIAPSMDDPDSRAPASL
ncbi:Formate [Hortaea werneckii]|nr:Formate [Hortaea werneckii]